MKLEELQRVLEREEPPDKPTVGDIIDEMIELLKELKEIV
jgi:hypothetical protein